MATVHLEHQGDCMVDCPDPSGLRIIDPTPVFTYRQHGRTYTSREPMYRVSVDANDGPWDGVVSCRQLKASGYFAEIRRSLQAAGHRRAQRRSNSAAIGSQ